MLVADSKGFCCEQECLVCDTPTICRQCQPLFILVRDDCCHHTCATCSGTLPTDCTSCASPNLLHSGRCLSSCPPGYYGVFPTETTCQPCSQICLTCALGSENCLTCAPMLVFSSAGVCQCHDGWYRDGAVCKACPTGCLVCIAS
jgi:hypothetical protein